MNEILIQILLVVAIITCVLLIANLIRLYQILSDLSDASDSIKNIFKTTSRILTSWKDSARNVAEFVGEVSKYASIFKKFKNDDLEKEKENNGKK